MSPVFNRICCSVFEDVEKIRVVSVSSKTLTTQLEPFVDHAIAAMPASEVPLHDITLSTVTLDEWEAHSYRRPNSDGTQKRRWRFHNWRRC
jgi:hypothetical protein